MAITLFEGLNNPPLSLKAKNFVSGNAFCDPSDVQHVSHRVRFFAIIAAYPEMYEIATTPKVICQTPYHLPLERRGWVDELGGSCRGWFAAAINLKKARWGIVRLKIAK